MSGGIDSSAIAFWRRPDLCLTIDYGQRPARGEIAASAAIAQELRIRHDVMTVNLSELGSGSLAGKSAAAIAGAPEWWPYRNQVLITLAAMKYATEGLSELIIGTVSTDKVHADGRPQFLKAIDTVMRAQEGGVRVAAPARRFTSAGLLKVSNFPPTLIHLTFSCHVMEYPCGRCRGCQKHRDVQEKFAAMLKKRAAEATSQ